MKKKTIYLLILMVMGFLLPFPVFAEEPVPKDKGDEKIIILRITDSERTILEGAQIVLYDKNDPKNVINQWTVEDCDVGIIDLEESHSYFIKETEVPDK